MREAILQSKSTGGYSVYYDETQKNCAVKHMLAYGTPWEEAFLDHFCDMVMHRRIIGRKPVILDIGAGIGTFLKHVLLRIPEAKGYAFEPVPDNLPALRRNMEYLNADVVDKALGSRDQRIVFGVPSVNVGEARVVPYNVITLQENLAMAEVIEKSISPVSVDDTGGNPIILKAVRMVRLDNYSLEFPDGDVYMKIDVEGFEVDVLLGMPEFVRKHKPVVCAEANTQKAAEDVLKVLRTINSDYKMFHGMKTALVEPNNVMAYFEVDE